MTFGENLSWKAGDPPSVPVDFSELILMIYTHCVDLATIFSEACPIYSDLQQITATVMSIKADRRKFTAQFCGQLTFALMLAEWTMGRPAMPTSMIPSLYEKLLTRETI